MFLLVGLTTRHQRRFTLEKLPSLAIVVFAILSFALIDPCPSSLVSNCSTFSPPLPAMLKSTRQNALW